MVEWPHLVTARRLYLLIQQLRLLHLPEVRAGSEHLLSALIKQARHRKPTQHRWHQQGQGSPVALVRDSVRSLHTAHRTFARFLLTLFWCVREFLSKRGKVIGHFVVGFNSFILVLVRHVLFSNVQCGQLSVESA